MRARWRKSDPGLVFTPPCLASLVTSAPDSADWVHEVKFDGYRIHALIEAGKARVLTRRGLDWTHRFRAIAEALSLLPVASAVIDGEAVVLDAKGISRFSLLQAELGRDGSGNEIVMMAFDLLHLDGAGTAHFPLEKRKQMLAELLAKIKPASPVRFVDHVQGHGGDFLAGACAAGLEGIISKRADLPYRSGRRGDWTKAKCVRSDLFVVLGYTLQKDNRALVGALILGFYETGTLVYAGRVGTGFSLAEARALTEGLAAIQTEPPAIARSLTRAQRAGTFWVKPILVAQIAWRDSTSDGLLRHASFERLRTDVPAAEIHRPDGFGHPNSP